jgi:hypothetical protein
MAEWFTHPPIVAPYEPDEPTWARTRSTSAHAEVDPLDERTSLVYDPPAPPAFRRDDEHDDDDAASR